jgi:cytochrome P450
VSATTSAPKTEPPAPGLSPLVQTVLYHRDPLGVLRRLRARHGPVFALRMTGKDPLVFVAERGALLPLLDAGGAGAARRGVLPQASQRSPFGADGAAHQAIRAAMAPAFAEPDRERIAAIAAEHAERWPDGRPFRALARMRTLATDIFVRLVLRVEDDRRRTALVAAIRRMLWTPGNPPLAVPDDGGVLVRRRMAPVIRLLEDELPGHRGDDLLARTREATADPIDALLVVIAAAQEPPGIALANVVYELARRPQWQERYREEPALRDAIAAEVLRLRPSASAALRELAEPAEIAGYALPAGTDVALPSALLQRDPEAFPAPDAFRPERFADGTPPGAPYFPFGGGARRCLGEPLARAELDTVLPVVLGRRRFAAVWPRPERMVVRGTVLVPHRGALVRSVAR